MRHKVAGRKLGRSMSHRRALYRNLVTDLLNYEKIVTTEAKAKEVRGLAEKMITLGKEGGLHAFRQALAFIMEKVVAEKVFSELASRYAERPGGYTRIIKLGPRLGDSAPMVQLSLVK
ncbi:MAG: 50S ribosomal protein L17 [Dehalococcoidales bacterium]|nr:50S ribosomal protein L17 [Dehalococcoidales bacterium]MDP6448512.1 50S ribosomal protein L17 [Dehalococcoidales bacterium]MDP6576706.1 50S ribosomal protein L17 [Dehalococcoidales bacterium]